MATVEGNAGSVEELILERLDDSGLPADVADLVVAALLGDDALAHALSAGRRSMPIRRLEVQRASQQPVRTYLQAITVEGFRGIGPEAALRLQPGPGLTLIAGRNGSGKSSFAEAVELALTGDDKRWSMPGRGAVWRAGWRNLHTPAGSHIAVALAADGQPGVISVQQAWQPGARLEDATVFVQEPGKPRRPLESLGWARPLELYRPFLSYSELGALLAGRPSDMYDALQAILGLDQLIEAERRLASARKRFEESSMSAARARPALLRQLSDHSDERARQAEAELRLGSPDLAVLEALAVGGEAGGDGLVGSLQQIASLNLPTAETARATVSRLATAERLVTELAGTPAADARRMAGLLNTALTHFADHPGQPCPVCGGSVLDETWAIGARAEVARLAKAAEDADDAHSELEAATRAMRHLVPVEPTVLSANLGGEVDPAAARVASAWQRWATLANVGTVRQLATEAGGIFTSLAAAVERFVTTRRGQSSGAKMSGSQWRLRWPLGWIWPGPAAAMPSLSDI
jgi:hypothetical protein